ncbi:MAG: hypothetical protein MK438_05250, partial [SAR324 cluster bacterium]|nr:hypothetical protein [SAR324 cluster bacterium]
EVNVCHEDLNGFLTIAEELKIKGLTQNDGKKSESTDINKERFIPKLKSPASTRNRMMNGWSVPPRETSPVRL